jgi:hypothetical protein
MRAGLGPIGIGTLIAAVLADRVTVATPLAVFTGKAVCRARAPLAVDDNIRPSPFLAFTELTSMNRYGISRPAMSGARTATPDVLQSLHPRRSSRHRSHKRLARRLSSPVAVVIAVSILAAAGATMSSRIAAQRATRALMTPKAWPTTTVELPTPVTAALTTDLGGSFLHYTLTVAASARDAAKIEDQLRALNFTIRLLDKDGFTILLVRPGEDIVSDRRPDGSFVFHIEDVVGCSPKIYGNAARWSVETEPR